MRDADGEMLDRAMLLVFPAPVTATGEDVVEFHVHGGRAVVSAIEAALGSLPGLRRAGPGEFTRRALENGRIDLAEAEGLADLLAAETDLQRRAALAMVDGSLSGRVDGWRRALLSAAATLEAAFDFGDELDVAAGPETIDHARIAAGDVRVAMELALAEPPVERLRDGIRVVLAGPPNSGKSTLFNRLAGRDAAIISPIPGTTRDRIEAPVARDGIPFVLIDTAGLRDATDDIIERSGIERTGRAMDDADIVLWLGDDSPPVDRAIWIHARADLAWRQDVPAGRMIAVADTDPASAEGLWQVLAAHAASIIPRPGDAMLNRRQREHVGYAVAALHRVDDADELIVAEMLRSAYMALGRINGNHDVEVMLDVLFSRFCIGK